MAVFDIQSLAVFDIQIIRVVYFVVLGSKMVNTYDLKSRHVNVCFSDGCYSDLGRQVNIVSKVYSKRVESAPKKLGKHTNVCAVKIL